MSRKSRAKSRKAWASWRSAKFKIGTTVKVVPGTVDPDFPEYPLGDWVGVVLDVNLDSTPILYRIAWSRETCAQMHPGYRRHCERAGLDLETMWLGEGDLQSHQVEAECIAQPAADPPVNRSTGDRVRAIFKVLADGPLPEVSAESLLHYHRHLTPKLKFPFEATLGLEAKGKIKVMVLALLELEECDLERGLEFAAISNDERVIRVPLGGIETNHPVNRPLIADYADWFMKSKAADAASAPVDWAEAPLTGFLLLCVASAVAGALFGLLLGAFVLAMESTQFVVLALATVGTFLGYIAGSYRPSVPEGTPPFELWPRRLNVHMAVAGGLVGALASVLIMGFPGALAGAILCCLVWRYLVGRSMLILPAAVGSLLGAGVLVFCYDWEQALTGAMYGSAIGAGGFVFLVLVVGIQHRMTARPKKIIRIKL